MASSDVILICFRANEPDVVRVDGAGEGICARCQAAIVVSPTSQRLLVTNPCAKAICLQCAGAELSGEVFDVHAIPGQAEEVRNHFGIP